MQIVCQVVFVAVREWRVSPIIETPGWHGWVRELACNEGDVPRWLPVSDARLNQERPARSRHRSQTSHPCCQGRCGCVHVWMFGCINNHKSLRCCCFFQYIHIDHTLTVADMLYCRHTVCWLSQWFPEPVAFWVEWRLCLIVSIFTDPFPRGSSPSYSLNEEICFSTSSKT